MFNFEQDFVQDSAVVLYHVAVKSTRRSLGVENAPQQRARNFLSGDDR